MSPAERHDDQRTLLPSAPWAAAEARRTVRAALTEAHSDPVLADEAELLVSELVTNAVRHGGGGVALGVQPLRGGIRLEVFDGVPELIRGETPAVLSEGGRGLALVEAIATRWGVQAEPAGKCVWAELVARPLG